MYLLFHTIHHFFETGSLSGPEAYLVEQQAWQFSCLFLPRTGIILSAIVPLPFQLGSGNPMSGTHNCTISAFLNNLLLQDTNKL